MHHGVTHELLESNQRIFGLPPMYRFANCNGGRVCSIHEFIDLPQLIRDSAAKHPFIERGICEVDPRNAPPSYYGSREPLLW